MQSKTIPIASLLMLLGSSLAFAGLAPVAAAACTVNLGSCDEGECLVNAGTCEKAPCGFLECTGGCAVNAGYCSGLCTVNLGNCQSGVDDDWPTYAGCTVNTWECGAGGQCTLNAEGYCYGDCDVNVLGTCASGATCAINLGYCSRDCPLNLGSCVVGLRASRSAAPAVLP